MSWTLALYIGLFLLGILLSAFFSGSETGFYRATRVRMVLDAREGAWSARMLLWLVNHPSLFVATTLVGNNVANYMVSVAVVLATGILLPSGGVATEILSPLVVAPLVFVYGELLPKKLFFQSPNKLLRWVSPAFMVFSVISFPITAILWGLSQIVAWFAGESPQRVQLALARKELRDVFDEGHAAGVLHPGQRRMAVDLITTAQRPVGKLATPIAKASVVNWSDNIKALRLAASKTDSPYLIFRHKDNAERYRGYLPTDELVLKDEVTEQQLLRLYELGPAEPLIAALLHMQTAQAAVALIVDGTGRATGVVTIDQLANAVVHHKP